MKSKIKYSTNSKGYKQYIVISEIEPNVTRGKTLKENQEVIPIRDLAELVRLHCEGADAVWPKPRFEGSDRLLNFFADYVGSEDEDQRGKVLKHYKFGGS